MTKRMLIDATQPEETRVVLTNGERVDDFDFEVASRKVLKGNIYLARVIRVEPSLQAAFVEYGGNRNGFLPFSEIHPDYYRIPMEDRQALIEATRHQTVREADDDLDDEIVNDQPDDPADGDQAVEDDSEAEPDAEPVAADKARGGTGRRRSRQKRQQSARNQNGADPEGRQYKIQEVIVRRQIMLVQVIKDERGAKGAAMSTYLSLAGRYCVLMPNSAHGGGVSRKITDAADRKRLKTVVDGLDVPQGMAIIVRTVGSQRNKAEIKRDYDYLFRLWDRIREQTLTSSAPCLIHEEANLIRRSIRDLYSRDIEEVLVEGEDGYRTAKNFMKTLMPSHARRIKRFSDGGVPLFQRFQVENQLDIMHTATVQLPSGGYVVLDQTEALVAIDVNSGRATRERNVEETALQTNLEAAAEISRQLRLRDLAGLIVIDFIDMYSNRNQQNVERRLRDELRHDRARVHTGRISQFGLMEMSRQRLRPSVVEASTVACPHCDGTGRLRSVESAALQVLRSIEEEGLKQRASAILVHMPAQIGFYILNNKRDALAELEQRYTMTLELRPDDTLVQPNHRIERLIPKPARERNPMLQSAVTPAQDAAGAAADGPETTEEAPRRQRRRTASRRKGADDGAAPEATESTASNAAASDEENGEQEDGSRNRRRRGRRGGRRRTRRDRVSDGVTENTAGNEAVAGSSDTGEETRAAENQPADVTETPQDDTPKPESAAPDDKADSAESAKRPARKRATTRGRRKSDSGQTAPSETADPAPEAPASADPEAGEPAPAKPRRTRASRKPAKAGTPDVEATDPPAPAANAATGTAEADVPAADPERSTQTRRNQAVINGQDEVMPDTVLVSDAPGSRNRTRRGWWNRSEA